MRIIASIIIAVVVSTLGFTAQPAAADDYRPVCVQDTDGLWFAYVIESQADLDWIGDRRVEPFPNSAVGCAAYGPQKTAPTIPQSDCEPVVRVVEVVVEKPVEVVKYVDRVVETSSTQTVVDTHAVEQLQRKVDRQQRVIAKLRTKLQRR
jgi:hypothetical protein